ncbi:MAG: hypothetical protein E7504_05420 [Ruminococcus sp.]|nr:hypothetical protein [Ruminococcus sp.]
MAQKKRKHGKVEARKSKPLIQFKLGVLLLLIVIAFGGCFALYLISATSQPDYWEKEIMASSQQETEESDENAVPIETKSGEPSAAVNPVPQSERADDVHMQICAWIGDVTELTTYYQTASEMVFPDAVSGMSESEMRSSAKKITERDPLAIYLWMNTPAEIADIADFTNILSEKTGETPVYILSALPAADGTDNKQAINDWNKQLFSLADSKGLHYVDVSTALKGNNGFLAAEYAKEDALNRAVGEIILTHVAK